MSEAGGPQAKKMIELALSALGADATAQAGKDQPLMCQIL